MARLGCPIHTKKANLINLMCNMFILSVLLNDVKNIFHKVREGKETNRVVAELADWKACRDPVNSSSGVVL